MTDSALATGMNRVVRFPSFQGQIGVAREEITPPAGIYWRLWGAAQRDFAEGVHRPLWLTAVTLQTGPGRDPFVLVDSDLICLRDQKDVEKFVPGVLDELSLEPARFIISFGHSHASQYLSAKVEPEWPGGELIEPYWKKVREALCDATRRALAEAVPATLTWHTGRCNLATNRDLVDTQSGRDRLVCGFNPEVQADDTVVVGRVTDASDRIIGTIVNYACHPTTLAWENRVVSPDYIGAMRETIEKETDGAPSMFLQGASGELAPRYQYVGDPEVADANGRHLGYAALAALADMEPPRTELVFDRVVESGAPLAVWKRQATTCSNTLRADTTTVDLPLKDWPPAAALDKEYRTTKNRALQERLRRKRDVRLVIGDGATYPLPIWVWQVGDAILAGCLVEAYSQLQIDLRRRFPENPVLFIGLVNGCIGYTPPAELYDREVYQVWQTPFDRGCLETLTEAFADAIASLTAQK